MAVLPPVVKSTAICTVNLTVFYEVLFPVSKFFFYLIYILQVYKILFIVFGCAIATKLPIGQKCYKSVFLDLYIACLRMR